MTRMVGRSVIGLSLVLVLGAGCQRQQSSIAKLDPYVGQRPRSAGPLPKRPPRVAQRPPARTPASENGWMPRGGISNRWKCVVVHHSGSDKSTPQGMRDWHVNGRGWDALGYHFVIGNGQGYPDGKVYVGERWPKQMHGAHCKTKSNFYNDHGIGICLIGDLNKHKPTAKQEAALANLLAFLSQKCGIPKSKIHTHGGVTHATECPGRHFSLTKVIGQMPSRPVWASSK